MAAMTVQAWDVRTQEDQAFYRWEIQQSLDVVLRFWAVECAWANIRPNFGPLDPVVAYVCQSCGQRSRQYGTTRCMNLDGSYRAEIACAGCRG